MMILDNGKQRFSSLAFKLSFALVIASIFGSAGSFFTKSLPGIPVMIGSAQGTALVILVVATPILAASTILARRGIGLA
jgi:hypothetical protein